jgi:glutathione S-transferase
MNALNISLGKSGEYLLGDRFTVADLNVESVLDWGLRVPGYEDHIKSNYPLVHAWMTKIRARPHHHANQNA